MKILAQKVHTYLIKNRYDMSCIRNKLFSSNICMTCMSGLDFYSINYFFLDHIEIEECLIISGKEEKNSL